MGGRRGWGGGGGNGGGGEAACFQWDFGAAHGAGTGTSPRGGAEVLWTWHAWHRSLPRQRRASMNVMFSSLQNKEIERLNSVYGTILKNAGVEQLGARRRGGG